MTINGVHPRVDLISMLGESVVGGKLAVLATQTNMLCTVNKTSVCIIATRMKTENEIDNDLYSFVRFAELGNPTEWCEGNSINASRSSAPQVAAMM